MDWLIGSGLPRLIGNRRSELERLRRNVGRVARCPDYGGRAHGPNARYLSAGSVGVQRMVKPTTSKADWLQYLDAQLFEGRWIVNADRLEALLTLLAERGRDPRDMVSVAWKAMEW